MFTTKDDLKLIYGVDMQIGKFFVDRKVPENNLYWKGRYLYINPMPGYLFIPIYTDIQYRLGLAKHELLGEPYAGFMEALMHSIGRQEFEKLTIEEHIKECVDITSPYCRNPVLLNELKEYFSGINHINGIDFGLSLKALNRVDSYLFTLCFFEFDNATKKKLVDAWHALMTYYLINDDVDDIKDDFNDNEDNCILEAGLSAQGAKIIEGFKQSSYITMETINPVFANRMDYSWQLMNVEQIITDYLGAEARSVN
ncbi:MAG: hypothetical protein QM763_25175 [Agriterribacter sp.]